MTAKSVGFIGGGRVTNIILGGLKRAGKMPRDVVVSDANEDVLHRLKAKYPEIRVAHNDNGAAAAQNFVFAALHPPALGPCMGEIKDCLKPGAILISLAPKLTAARLTGALGGFNRIVRVIPNAPSIIGEGFNPISFSDSLDRTEREEVIDLMRPLGKCPVVEEGKLEAYAILTAMGPTYLWFQLNELQTIAECCGLSRGEAQAGTSEMAAGAAKTLFGSGMAAEEVMDLIPVKPLGEDEAGIKAAYHARLEGLYAKLRN